MTSDPGRSLLVVALGGNAIQAPDGDDSVASDFARTRETVDHLVALSLAGPWRLVLTHGNGPQVGNHLLRSELGVQHGGLPRLPLDVCVADTQGGMGYMIQQCLSDAFHGAGRAAVVASVVTQTIVDPADPAFAAPSKPIGEMIPEEGRHEAEARGWTLVEDRARGGYRRVVASPDPLEIVEADAIEGMVERGVVVVAAGGGGIPVFQRDDGALEGAAAVVDKDLAAALLACDLRATSLLILTDVDGVHLGFRGPGDRLVREMTASQGRRHLDAGEFPPGSMGPKVEAACRFVEATGRPAAITSIELSEDALAGREGTRILP